MASRRSLTEEERFRQRHEVLIRGIIKSLGSFQIDVESLVTLIADSLLGNYSTDLTLEDMIALGAFGFGGDAHNTSRRFLFMSPR